MSLPVSTPWRTAEITLRAAADHKNPYLELEPRILFSGPDGSTIERPAFWDGGRTWRVRFAAPMAGEWRYTPVHPTGDDGLDASAGAVLVEEQDEELAVYRHGFLRAASAGNHLEHADGTPFFWLGDTHWRFAWESWDGSNKPGWSSQFRGIVDRRVTQGFSVYQSNILSFGGGWEDSAVWRNGAVYRELDVDYFRTVLDPRMAYIADEGLVNALGLAWFPAADHDADGLARFARYIVARYGSYPIAWTLGGEVAGYDPRLRRSRIDGWRRVALAIRDADDYGHPRSAHLTNERPIADYYQGEDWLTFTLHQHGHGDLDLGVRHYADHLAAYPGVPLIEGESMYEGIVSVEPVGRRVATDAMVRQVAYRAIQSGCCGYSYGAQGCWNNAWEYGDGKTMWGDLPWYEGVDLPGGAQMGHLRRFYESLDWTKLRPTSSVFDAGGLVNAVFYPPAVSADEDRRTVVAYFGETYRSDEGTPVLTGLLARPYRLRWCDPRTGLFTLIADAAIPNHGSLPVPPKPTADADWLLVAEARGPGSGLEPGD
jgi:hypothetical protein